MLSRITHLLTSVKSTKIFGDVVYLLSGRKASNMDYDFVKVNNVCVIRLDAIGDVVMTTPFIRELRRNLPDAFITIIVKPELFNLIETCPYVDEVLIFDWYVQERLATLKLYWRALNFSRKKLWPKHYDLAILPRWDADYYYGSYIAYFSGATWRIGYSENVSHSKKRANKGYDGLFSNILIATDPKHEVEKNLEVIEYLGGQVREYKTELWLTKEDEDFAKGILDKNSIFLGFNQLIAFCPGAGKANKRWPLENFVDLGRILNQYQNIRILVIGGPNEEHYGKWLVRNLDDKVVNLVGKLTLRQTAAVLKECTLYVGNDTGPKHLAAAVGTPVIEISKHPIDCPTQHANSPKRFGPWGVPSMVLQPKMPVWPCSDSCTAMEAHCICEVTVGQVAEATFQLIAKHA